jgi:hypothetical protein
MPQTGHFIVGRSQHCVLGQIKCEGDIVETSKPDLRAASPRAVASKRILAQLEHGARTPASPPRIPGWTVDGWTIGLCALLLFMCGVAWLMHDKRLTPETFRHNATYASVRSAPTPTPPRPTQQAESSPTLEQAAAIINEAQPAAATPTHGVSHIAGASPPTPTAVSAAIANAASAEPSRAARQKPAAPATTTTRDQTAAAARPNQASGDTDVALLTALVAHAGKPSVVTPERSRDVVERQDGETTAQLLARCKQLGLIEGMLCRSRICSGRWESDAACRAPAR